MLDLRKKSAFIFLVVGLLLVLLYASTREKPEVAHQKVGGTVKLPKPKKKGGLSVEEALSMRRSIREYSKEPLTLEEVSQLLWAGQGITAEWGGRTAPSAGATYPLTLYLIAEEVIGLQPGIYIYRPEDHSLSMLFNGSFRNELYNACLKQESVKKAPASIVIVAIYERTTRRYGERGIRYVHIETGCVVQNIYLQCTSLNLGTVCIGAFIDEEVSSILGLEDAAPLIVMPVGHKP